MTTSRKLTSALLALFALVVMSASAFAADPGSPYPATSEISDQKAGSILIFNYYTSVAGQEASGNTRINITNTSSTSPAYVHVFFVANGCSVADNFLCLTKNQTATFLISDVDPGMKGYIVAVAVDQANGCPVAFNHLIGDEYVKTADGFEANLGAEAIAALYGTSANPVLPGCNDQQITALLKFNGKFDGYNCLPRVLALSSIPSPSAADTKVVINRIGGSLMTSAETIGSMFGWLFDDAENAFSFTVTGGCQYEETWKGNTPRVTPRIATLIPAQRTGWSKLWANADRGILGAMIVNPTAGEGPDAFEGGHNLHKLTLTCVETYIMPVFPPSC
jgi:hypothetical protein